MIDDIGKTMALMEKMEAALPLRANATEDLRRALQEQSDKIFPRECRVFEIRYMNDEGGISCHLDFGFSGPKNVYVVSITHLKFGRGSPLAREIEAYRKHRIKRLKNLNRGTTSLRH